MVPEKVLLVPGESELQGNSSRRYGGDGTRGTGAACSSYRMNQVLKMAGTAMA